MHHLVDLYEVIVFLLLAGEYLYEHRAAHGQCLVYLLVEFVALRLALRQVFPARAAGGPRREYQERYDRDPHKRQRHTHAEERYECGDNSRDVANDVGESPAYDGAHAAYVGVHTRDYVALLLSCEEGMRHVLQMPVHLISHVKDDALRDPRVYVVFENAYELAHCERGKSRQQQLYEELHVFAHERLVYDAARQY